MQDRSKKMWRRLDPSDLDDVQKNNAKGVHVELSLSPYDIPEAFRGRYCEKENKFIIEFKYLSEELQKEIRLDEYTLAMVGKNSRRIYALKLDVHSLGVKAVSLSLGTYTPTREQIGEALDRVAKSTNRISGTNEERRELQNRLFDAVKSSYAESST